MKKNILFIFIFSVAFNYAVEQKTIKFKFSDSSKLEVPFNQKTVLKKSRMINVLLSDTSDDNTGIPLLLNKNVFEEIIGILNMDLSDATALINTLQKKSDKQIAQIANAADYLDIPELLNAAIKVLAEKLSVARFVKNTDYLSQLNINPNVAAQVTHMFLNLPEGKRATREVIKTVLAEIQKPIKRFWHQDMVTSVAFSPDNKRLAIGSDDKTARIWNIEKGTCEKKFVHSGWVWAVAFSPDGKYLATGSVDVRIWDINSGAEIQKIAGFDGWVFSVAFSPDGKYLATGSEDEIARIWNLALGTEEKRFTHSDMVWSVTFNSDGKYLATGSRDKTARIWNVETGKEEKKFRHDDWVSSVAFSFDDKYLVSGSKDKTARIWNVHDQSEVKRFKHDSWVSSAIFTPSGNYLATGSNDTFARIWEVESGAELKRFKHGAWVVSVAISPDSNYMATGASSARIFDIELLNVVLKLIDHLTLEQALLIRAFKEINASKYVTKHQHLKMIFDSLDPLLQSSLKKWIKSSWKFW